MKQVSKNVMKPLSEEIKARANDLKDDNLRSLIITADLVHKYVNTMLLGEELNLTEMYILNTLIIHGGSMNPSDIARRVYRSPHAITRAVDILEKMRYVRREAIGEDRRMRKVSITEEGLEIVKQNMPQRLQINSTVMSCLNQTQMEQLSVILKLLQKNLRLQIDKLREKSSR